MSPFEAPTAGIAAVRYEMEPALTRAHQNLSNLAPDTIGSYLEIFFAITKDGSWYITFYATHTEVLRRARGRIRRENQVEGERWRAENWPFEKPIHLFGIQVWPPFRVKEVRLIAEPEIPEHDSWQPGGKHYEEIAQIVAYEFAPCLESLWKAAFAQDPFVAEQLRQHGYNLDDMVGTRLGMDPLRDLLRRANAGDHRTMFGDPVIIQHIESGESTRSRVTPLGGATYEVEIDDPEE